MEYSSVSIGKKVMFIKGVGVKTQNHHPMFNVRTKKGLIYVELL